MQLASENLPASTGTAANLIGGQTIHSWAGVGLAAKSRYQLVENIRANKTILDRWITVKAIVIDEISLVTADFFDQKVCFIISTIRLYYYTVYLLRTQLYHCDVISAIRLSFIMLFTIVLFDVVLVL